MANEVWGGGVIANIKLNKVMIDIASGIIVLHWELGLCQEDIIKHSGVGRTIGRRPKEWRSISVSIFPPNLLRRVIVWKALCRWKGTVQALSENQASNFRSTG